MGIVQKFRVSAEHGFVALGGARVGRSVLKLFYGAGYVRAINYHGTPTEHAVSFEQHLQFYAKHFDNLPRDRFQTFFDGTWRPKRPALMLCFDDGELSNFEIAAPLLEKYGFTGFFLVCPSLVGRDGTHLMSREEAAGFVDPEARDWIGPLVDYSRKFMSWDQIRDLHRRGHVIGSHTLNHIRMPPTVPMSVMKREIELSRERIALEIGASCQIFCWVGGEEVNFSRSASHIIENAGYEFSMLSNAGVMSHKTQAQRLQRTNVDASWPQFRAQFAGSGVVDVLYYRKRASVSNAITDT